MKPIKLVPALFAALTAISDAPALSAGCTAAIGVICQGGKAMDRSALIDVLRGADIVILGERHDNPAHHSLQAEIVAELAPAGLAFEMVPEAKEDLANAARDIGDDLAEALEWETTGWGDWDMYGPIFDAAPNAWIAGGGVERDLLRVAIAEGAAKAFGERADVYGLNERFEQDVIDAMLDEQDRAHCGAMPTAMLPGMVEAQQLRDAAFADAALRLVDRGEGQVVLITGNGHARTDRGVPLYIARAKPEATVISIGQVELTEGAAADQPLPYEPLPYDIVIYTQAHDRGDPCADFIKSRQKP